KACVDYPEIRLDFIARQWRRKARPVETAARKRNIDAAILERSAEKVFEHPFSGTVRNIDGPEMLGVGHRHLGNAQQEDHFRRTGPECHASLTKELTVLRLHIEI